MQVKSIAECSKGSILQYFRPSFSQSIIKIFVLSIFEWPLKTGFTVQKNSANNFSAYLYIILQAGSPAQSAIGRRLEDMLFEPQPHTNGTDAVPNSPKSPTSPTACKYINVFY